MTDLELVAAYCRELRLVRGGRPQTVYARRRQISRWVEWLGENGKSLATASRHDVLEWLPDVGPSARKTYIAALNVFHEWLIDEGVRPDNPLHRFPRPIQHRQLPRAISDEDAARVWAKCPDDARIAIGLAMMCGLRCQELSGARWEEIEWGSPVTLLIGTDSAKGGHERRVVVPDELAALLKGQRRKQGWLARGPEGQGSNPNLMSQWLSHTLREECVTDCSAHQLRHWHATALLRRGANLAVVQQALGHASLATTGLYLRVTIADHVHAVDLAPPVVQQPAPPGDHRDRREYFRRRREAS